jgi:hypothetical protein
MQARTSFRRVFDGNFLVSGLPLILLNRNETDCKQQPCRKQGGIHRSAGEKVKRTTSSNSKYARIKKRCHLMLAQSHRIPPYRDMACEIQSNYRAIGKEPGMLRTPSQAINDGSENCKLLTYAMTRWMMGAKSAQRLAAKAPGGILKVLPKD